MDHENIDLEKKLEKLNNVEKQLFALKAISVLLLALLPFAFDYAQTKCENKYGQYMGDLKNIQKIIDEKESLVEENKHLLLELKTLQADNLFRNNIVYPLGFRIFKIEEKIPTIKKNELFKNLTYSKGNIDIKLEHSLFESLHIYYTKNNNIKIIDSLRYYIKYDDKDEKVEILLFQLKKEFPNIKILEHKEYDGHYIIKNLNGMTIEIDSDFHIDKYKPDDYRFENFETEYKFPQ